MATIADLVADTFCGVETAGGEEDLGAEVGEPDRQGSPEVAAGGRDDDTVVVESHGVTPQGPGAQVALGRSTLLPELFPCRCADPVPVDEELQHRRIQVDGPGGGRRPTRVGQDRSVERAGEP
jgi:hypothetical protein